MSKNPLCLDTEWCSCGEHRSEGSKPCPVCGPAGYRETDHRTVDGGYVANEWRAAMNADQNICRGQE
jgi:hypothetical protein